MFVATVAAGKRAVRGWGDPPPKTESYTLSVGKNYLWFRNALYHPVGVPS